MAASFLKITFGDVIRFIIINLLLAPLWMLLIWFFTAKRTFVVAIIDKTVLTTKGQEHISLNWVLNQEKFTLNKKKLYQRERDYFGFFPKENEKYQLKGLERFSIDQLDKLSDDADAAYITDAYGIYRNEWFKQGDEKERSGIIYGGMSKQDTYFLGQMQKKHKLIITEFNCLASPTTPLVRSEFENNFGIRWSGWIGRYFETFDTLKNKELPHWLIKNYLAQHNGQWPFTKSGIAFVHSDDRVEILENKTHLNNELPFIYSTKDGMDHYGITEKCSYPYWFDIITPDTSFNHVLARFSILVNDTGAKLLKQYGIPSTFPAITAHVNQDYRFFYFSADFADNPISFNSSYFKGVPNFNWFMYNNREPLERKAFFWKIYQPLVTTIMNDYYKTLKKDQ